MPSAFDLAETLSAPYLSGGLDLLLETWRHDETEIVCRLPHDLEDHPDLAVRIRGAFGRMLAELPPPIVHRYDPFGRPAPFAVLFGDYIDARGTMIPKPFVIDADVIGTEVVVRLRIFGEAMFWAAQARDAMVMALAQGVSIRSESRHKVAFEPLSCSTRRIEGLAPPCITRDAALRFVTPLVVRNGSLPGLSPRSLVNSLIARAIGMARWQGLALELDHAELQLRAEAITLDVSDLMPVGFRRHSRRQPGNPIPVLGFAGKLGLQGPLIDISPLLAVSAVAHLGSHAALGLGRCDVFGYG
jgi:CRISPR-associated endoribonuclease Cas6